MYLFYSEASMLPRRMSQASNSFRSRRARVSVSALILGLGWLLPVEVELLLHVPGSWSSSRSVAAFPLRGQSDSLQKRPFYGKPKRLKPSPCKNFACRLDRAATNTISSSGRRLN